MYKLLIMCINKGAVIKTTEASKSINKYIFSFDWSSTFEGDLLKEPQIQFLLANPVLKSQMLLFN